jgi:hypothetical protein
LPLKVVTIADKLVVLASKIGRILNRISSSVQYA